MIDWFSKFSGRGMHQIYATPIWKIDRTLLEFPVYHSKITSSRIYFQFLYCLRAKVAQVVLCYEAS